MANCQTYAKHSNNNDNNNYDESVVITRKDS